MSEASVNDQSVSKLNEINDLLKNEGFTSVQAMIDELQKVRADRQKAEEARDKMAEHNKEAGKIIGSKGAEIGILKQKITELETQLEEAGVSADNNNGNSQPPADPTPQKSAEEELAEVEKKMTDEQWQTADALLQAEQDDRRAIDLVENPTVRLKFLKDLINDPSMKRRPQSFRRQKADTTGGTQTPSGGGMSDYERLKNAISGNVLHGPSGHAAMPVKSAQQPRQSRRSSRLMQ